MTRDEVVAIIAARLGNRGTAFDAQIVTELKSAQEEHENRPQLPWFLLYHDTALVTVTDTKTISVPTDFLMEDDYSHMFVIGTDGGYNPVRKGDYDSLRGSVFYSANNIPARFALQGNTIHFFPTPDAVYTLDWHYYKRDTVLSSNVENEWLEHAHGVLLNSAGAELARFLRDANAVGIFEAGYGRAHISMINQDEARRQAALDAFMGG